ncbi:MAG TPA: O-antigen ligase family protein [Patescibacteria group bacterium]|nr:O-antigen ligase family protein [Patescibacteria group bacterium]
MIEWLFYILFFISPLIFYPKTSEVFEFNKIVVVYIFTVLITGAWIIKSIQNKKFIFKRTILDIPLLIFIGSQIISTILSIDQRTSIFGYYSRFNGGLLSTICYALLYFAFVNNFDKEKSKKIILITLISATVVAIYGIMEHFGGSISCIFVSGKFDDNCWVQDVRTRVFATLGQPNWLAAMLTSLVPLAWYGAFQTKQQRNKIIYITLSVIFFACILFTKSRSGLLGLAAASFIFGIYYFKKYWKQLIIIGVLFLSAILIFGTDITPSIFQLAQHKQVVQTTDTSEGGTESGAIREIVWKGALQIAEHYPIFGTGVETFGYSYWQYRPIEHNTTSEWDYLYNKAHNEYLNFLANTGAVGLITYLIFIGVCIYTLRKNIALLAGFISILITNFFGFSVVIISVFTFIMPALAITLNKKNIENKQSFSLRDNQKLFIAGIFMVGGFLIFTIAKYWLADYHYNYAQNELNAGQYSDSVKDIQTAINYQPDEAIYHNEAARIFTAVTVGFLDNKQATDAAQIAPYALNESDIAFSESPRNMNIRETRMSVFLELSPFDASYTQQAINLINDTIPLSPTDPKLPLLLGKTYANEGKLDLAIQEINKSLKLKPDYADAKNALEAVEKLQNQKKK